MEDITFSNNSSNCSFIYIDHLIKFNEQSEKEYMDNRNKFLEERNKKNVEELRKQKNRISAKKSRNKKNKEIKILIEENKRLREENLQLKKQINEIKDKFPCFCINCKNIIENIFITKNKNIFSIYKDLSNFY